MIRPHGQCRRWRGGAGRTESLVCTVADTTFMMLIQAYSKCRRDVWGSQQPVSSLQWQVTDFHSVNEHREETAMSLLQPAQEDYPTHREP